MTVFSLGDEQLALRDAVRRFCASQWSAEHARHVEYGEGDRWDAAAYAELGRMGILGLAVPTCYGGEGAAWIDSVVAFEELGRALFLSPHYVSAAVSGRLLSRFGSSEIRQRLLPGLASGATVVASDLLRTPVREEPRHGPGGIKAAPAAGSPAWGSDNASGLCVQDGFVTGLLRAVPYAEIAQFLLIAAPIGTTQRPTAATVAGESDRAELLLIHRDSGSSRCRRVGSLAGPPLHDVELMSSPVERLTPAGVASNELERELTQLKLLLAAEAIGGAKSALELAVSYASERKAFGQHIGSFQALQHKMADMAVQIEAADTAAYYAARQQDADDNSIAITSLAVLGAVRAYSFCARNAVQIYGGAGIMADSHVSLHFRRSRALEQTIGRRSRLEYLIARDLLSNPVRGIPAVIAGSAPGEQPKVTPHRPSVVISDQAAAGTAAQGRTEGSAMISADTEGKLRHEFRQYFRRIITPEVRAEIDESNGDYSEELYKELGRSGYIGLGIPVEYGGRGLGYTELAIFEEEANLAGLPHGVMSVLEGSAHFTAQLLIRIGTEAQRQQYLPGIMRGDYRFTQGFTEPECGSDMAAVQCFARRHEGGYALTGQKVFNSAHVVTHMVALVRTNHEAAKHVGISLLLVDLRKPGVTLLPMYTMRGWRRNLVIFDETPVPADALVGEQDQGWYALMSVIDLERSGIGLPSSRWRVLQHLLHDIQARPGLAEEILTHERQAAALAAAYRATQLGWLLARKVSYLQDQGENVTAQASFQKLFNGEAAEGFVDAVIDLLGEEALIDRQDTTPGGSLGRTLSALYLDCRIWQIAGGSSEIQRNIIARRILRLPSA